MKDEIILAGFAVVALSILYGSKEQGIRDYDERHECRDVFEDE